jgi:hypothetical protein
LAGKTHELKDYDWGPMLMSRVIDTLYDKMKTISERMNLIEDDSFMMNIFEEYLEELQPFKEYWSLMFEKKRMSVVVWSSKDGSKVVHMERLRAELFSPTRPTNVKTKEFVVGLANTAAKAICDKLVDESKATYKYTSMSKSDHSYKHCSEERKRALLGKRATNDKAKSALGGATANIQRYGRINISSAGAMSDVNQNKFLQQEFQPQRKKSATQSQGMLFEFINVVQEAIVWTAMIDAPSTRKTNNAAIQAQDTR